MYFRPFKRRARYKYCDVSDSMVAKEKKRTRGPLYCFLLFIFLVIVFSFLLFLVNIATQIAVSDAKDAVVSSINSAVIQIMDEGNYSADSFVSFEKSDDGTVTLISSNVAEINSLSAALLNKVVGDTGDQMLTIHIPIGNLTGISYLMGHGADIPIDVVLLTSSKVEFNNSIVSAGINQTKHQINLDVIVDIDVIIPWGAESAQVITAVLIADTVIVGHVPDSYFNVQ